MTQGNIKVQRPFPERLWKTSVVRVEEMIVKLKADSQNAVCNLVLFLSNVEQCLAKVPAQVKCWSDVGLVVLVSAVVKLLTKLPTAFPRFFVCVSSTRITEYPFSVNRAEGSQSIA
jgi:hypothetical protein